MAPAVRPRRVVSLRVQLAAGLLGLGLLIALAYAVVVAPRIRRHLIGSEVQKILLYASAVASQIRVAVAESVDELEAVARLPAVRRMDRLTDSTLAVLAQVSSHYETLVVRDPAGRIVASSAPLLAFDEPATTRDYFRLPLATGTTAVGEARTDSTGAVHVLVGAAIRDDRGRSAGVLCGRLLVTERNPELYAALHHPQIGSAPRAMLLSAAGRLIAGSVPPGAAPGGDLSGRPEIRTILDRPRGRGSEPVRDSSGTEWFGAAAKVPPMDWRVVVQSPAAGVRQGVAAALAPIVPLGVIALLVVLGLALLGLQQISRPIRQLTMALSGYGRDGYAAPVRPRGVGEVREALDAFNTMAAERVRADQERQEQERRVNAIMDSASAAIYLINRDDRILMVNRQWERCFGRSSAEVVGRPVDAVLPPEVLARQRGWQQRPAAATAERNAIVCLASAEQGERTFLWVQTPILGRSGEPEALCGVATDITELQQAEAHRARLVAILENTPDMVGITSPDGRVQYLNAGGVRLTGMTRDPTTTRVEDYHPRWAADLMRNEALPTAIARGTWSGQSALITADGREVPVWQVVIAHRGRTGELEFLSTIARDLTERLRLEEQLRQSQKMEGLGRLAGGVAHDFNNLLTAIIGYGTFLSGTFAEGDDRQEDVQDLLRTANRAADLTRQLLAFARRQIVEPRVTDVNALLRRGQGLFRRLVGENIEFGVILTDQPCVVRIDPVQLEQVVLNLVVNARDAMPEGGRVTLESEVVDLDAEYASHHVAVTPGRFVRIMVSDTGAGMGPATLARLFEPFFTTKEKGEGTGLGLAVSYGIIKQAGGHIWVYSEPGQGASFKIYLPAEPAGAVPELPPPEPAEDLPVGGTETILLVEDEPVVRSMAQRALTEAGYRVLATGSPLDALTLAAEHPGEIQLLLTDVIMPQMSGKRLADELQQRQPGIAVLYMSGYTENTIVHHGVLDPGVVLLPKPFTPGALCRKVREVLNLRGATGA